MPPYYPPVGFHFRVEVLGLSSPDDADLRFTDVSGLSVEMATEEVAEGGQNRFVQKFPVRAKYPELVLKRGLLVKSTVAEWVRACVEDFAVAPKSVNVTLLNAQHEPLLTWRLVNAYPTKWSVSDLSATSSAVVVETLQLYYQSFTLDRQSATIDALTTAGSPS
jgi:phage tail-like protein